MAIKYFCDLCGGEQVNGVLYELDLSITPSSERFSRTDSFGDFMSRSAVRLMFGVSDSDMDEALDERDKPRGIKYRKKICRRCAAKLALGIGAYIEQSEKAPAFRQGLEE